MKNFPRPAAVVFWAAVLSVYGFLACWKLSLPGLYYDEVNFINIALGSPAGDFFVHSRWHGIPVMMMAYLGALKGWIHYPVLSLFGTSAVTLRLPSIIIGAGAIALTYRYVKRLFGPTAGALAAVMLAADPAFVFSVRYDWGPSALMMFFKAMLLAGAAGWLKTGSPAALAAALSAAALGCYDKLDFVWIALGAAGAALAVYPDRFRQSVRENKFAFGLAFGLAIPCAFRFAAYVRSIDGVFAAWPQIPARLREVWTLLRINASGGGPYHFIFGDDWHAKTYLCALGGAAVLAGISARLSGGLRSRAREILFIAVTAALTAAQFFITLNATGAYHAVLLTPLGLVILAALISPAFEPSAPSRRLKAAKILSAAALALVLTGAFRVDAAYIEALGKPVKNKNWDPASYRLGDYVRRNLQKRYFCADWGFASAILALTGGKADCVDFWSWFLKPKTDPEISWFERAFVKPGTVFVVHAAGAEVFAETRKNFFEQAERRRWPLRKILEVPLSSGGRFAELYEVQAETAGRGRNLRTAKLVSGWYYWESGGIWTAKTAEADFLSGPEGKLVLSGYLPDAFLPNRITLSADGKPLAARDFAKGRGEIRLEAAGLPPNAPVRLKITVDKTLVPKKSGLCPDERELGMLVSDILFR